MMTTAEEDGDRRELWKMGKRRSEGALLLVVVDRILLYD